MVAAWWLAGLAGCQQAPLRPQGPALALGGTGEGPKLTARQAADVQVALARSLELRGEGEQAMAIYREALRRDPSRADAYLRLAILCDQHGKFDESAGLYRKALAAQPGNAEIYCDMGYSLSLQRRWAEAEMNLRQAVALAPNHRRAHNNLGLVLGHGGRLDEALAEFRKGGCDDAEAHVNLAFVLTLERCWPEARSQYEQALALQPASAAARKGLEELEALMAKGDADEDPLGTGNRWRRVRGCAHDELASAVPKGMQAVRPARFPEERLARDLSSRAPAAAPVRTAAAASSPGAGNPASSTYVTGVVYTEVETPAPPAPSWETSASTPTPQPAAPGPEIVPATALVPAPPNPAVATPPCAEPPTTERVTLPTSQAAQAPPPPVVSPLARLQQQVATLCGHAAREVEVHAESTTSLRIRLTVRSVDEGYKLATKILWMPEFGPYQVALDMKVVP